VFSAVGTLCNIRYSGHHFSYLDTLKLWRGLWCILQ